MVRGRKDWPTTLETLTKVEPHEDGSYSFTKSDGWSFWVGASEVGDFVPQVGDWVLMENPVNNIATVIIEGHVLRHKSQAEIDDEFEQWKKNRRLEQLETYVKHGDALRERARNLPKPLRERMERLSNEGGVQFWIDSAGYEMAVLEGAAALLRKVKELNFINDVDDPAGSTNATAVNDAVQWIKDWWDINSDKHDPPYDYKKQMEIVPDFGEGHSGFTASAARSLAIGILEGIKV